MSKKTTAGAQKTSAATEKVAADVVEAPQKTDQPQPAKVLRIRFVNHSGLPVAIPEIGQWLGAVSCGERLAINASELPAAEALKEQVMARNYMPAGTLSLEVNEVKQ